MTKLATRKQTIKSFQAYIKYISKTEICMDQKLAQAQDIVSLLVKLKSLIAPEN
jgi:hypothetical protein